MSCQSSAEQRCNDDDDDDDDEKEAWKDNAKPLDLQATK